MDVTETQLLVRRNQSATLSMLHNSIREYLLHKNISNSSKYPLEYYTRSELTFPLPSNTRLVLQWRHQEYSTDGAGSLPWSFQQHWLPLQLLGRAGAVPNDGEITHAQLGAIRNHLTWPCQCPQVPAPGQRTHLHWQSPSVQPVSCTLPTAPQAWTAQTSKWTIHWACAPGTWPRGQNARKTDCAHINIYMDICIHPTHTQVFSVA